MTDNAATCETCRYLVREGCHATCRRKAPGWRPHSPIMQPAYQREWPKVRLTEWCGEHAPAPGPSGGDPAGRPDQIAMIPVSPPDDGRPGAALIFCVSAASGVALGFVICAAWVML